MPREGQRPVPDLEPSTCRWTNLTRFVSATGLAPALCVVDESVGGLTHDQEGVRLARSAGRHS